MWGSLDKMWIAHYPEDEEERDCRSGGYDCISSAGGDKTTFSSDTSS